MYILISSKQCNVYKIVILSLSIRNIKNVIQLIKLQQILLKVLENAKKKIYYYWTCIIILKSKLNIFVAIEIIVCKNNIFKMVHSLFLQRNIIASAVSFV